MVPQTINRGLLWFTWVKGQAGMMSTECLIKLNLLFLQQLQCGSFFLAVGEQAFGKGVQSQSQYKKATCNVFNSSIMILQSVALSFCHTASIKRGLFRFWMAVRKHLWAERLGMHRISVCTLVIQKQCTVRACQRASIKLKGRQWLCCGIFVLLPFSSTTGTGHTIQAVWADHEPTDLQHNTCCHTLCCLGCYKWSAGIQY